MTPMMGSETLWAALVLVAAVNTSAVAGDVTNQATADDAQPSIETSQISGELRAMAGALSSGSEAMQPFHGLRSQHEDNKDDLNPAIPGMECYIDRIFNYVSCYSPTIGTETGADALFQLIVDELQTALPSTRWVGIKQKPGVDSIRSYLYQDQKSYAHIDVDIVPRIDPEGISSYMISIFAWTD
jgi:hypothetical protein